MNVMITGGAGFIGSHTANLMAERRFKVMVLDNFSTGKSENLKGYSGGLADCDITNEKQLELVFRQFRPDVILHLAAQSAITTAWDDPGKDEHVNIRGTLNLLMLARKYSARRFVFASTSAVYGPGSPIMASREFFSPKPETPYGVSKMAAENYIRLFFDNHVILRYANVYGPRQRPIGENQVVARAFAHFCHGADFQVVGDGNQKRDFVYVEDVAHANYLSAIGGEAGTYNVASGYSYSVNAVLAEIERYYAVKGYGWVHTRNQDKRGSVYLSGDKFRKTFGWMPMIGITKGITRTAEWWKQ
jgi:UDP-glucose 4-epimerase